jgi:hypothetical protein
VRAEESFVEPGLEEENVEGGAIARQVVNDFED